VEGGTDTQRDMQAAQKKKKKVGVGNVISVYWPEDKTWYHGEVISLGDDDDSSDEICEVLYEDGEREVINLKEEKYKISNKGRSSRNVCLLADGDVHAQLASIREILYDIADRLPSKGVSSSRQAWWQAWYEGIDSAVEANSIPLLVSFVEKLARILRPSIKTNWWKSQVCCFCSTCCSKSSDCMYTCVYSIFVRSFLVLSKQNVLFCLSSFLPSSTSERLV
jgi:hypothetical protein